jgi:hypothetical protein
MVEEESK